MSICPAFPPGNDGDTNVGTVGCRYNATQNAAPPGNDTLWCPRADYTGDGICGTLCEAYCNMTLYACTTYNQVYPDYSTCMAACSIFNTSGPSDFPGGYNTLNCRLDSAYDCMISLPTPPDVSCPRVSPFGDQECGEDLCENYCDFSALACTGVNAQYPNRSACLSYCENFPRGLWNDTSGNTLGCRIYHTLNAWITKDYTHCIHGGITGGNTCGTWCDVYCQLANDNCIGSNQLFSNTGACTTACGLYASTAYSNSTTGNSVQCRINHLANAGIETDATTDCTIGNTLGGLVCTFGGPGPAPSPSPSKTENNHGLMNAVGLILIGMIAMI